MAAADLINLSTLLDAPALDTAGVQAILYAGYFFHAEAASAGHNLLAPLQPLVRAGLFPHLIADLRRTDRPRPH